MKIISSLLAGLIFGIGLIVSGMINPAKVLNFLDLAGTWDPSLAFVMGGALAVTMIGYRLVRTQARPAFAPQFYMPTARDIDASLLAGAACFGVGWGLSGFCPGPVVTGLALHADGTLAFVPSMLVGMWSARIAKGWFDKTTTSPAA
jgi:uncharacterized membrane protein YedE/YeeE